MIQSAQADRAMERLIRWTDAVDLPMFVLACVPDGRVEYVHANAAQGHVTAVAPSHFRGRSATEVFPTRMGKRLDAIFHQCLKSDAPCSYEECLVLDGRETWWQTSLSKPAGFGGRVILGVTLEITEAKEREFAAARSLADMTERFDDLRLFSTMAAHDARGPLATVSSLIDLVLEEFEDNGNGKAELLRMASNTISEALGQINSTLQRARSLDAGDAVRKPIDLGRLCRDIAAMIDPGMHLAIDLPQTHVECNEVMVQMGIRNLMSNAARFCEHHITVQVNEDRTRGMLWVEVADDGPGLPQGMTLQDLTAKGEARNGVHGFGLSAIAQLVNSRGGTFEVVPPDPDDDMPGARFRITLPGKILGGGIKASAPPATAQVASVAVR